MLSVISTTISKTNPGPLVTLETLTAMYKAGLNLVEQAVQFPEDEHKRFWFGVAGMTDSADIDRSAAKMQGFMNGGLKKLNFICTGTQGSMMSFNQYAKLKVHGGPADDLLDKSTNVMANVGFSSDRYSFGEKVGAMLHEITHMCIGTDDVTILGKEYYGADYCVELAAAHPNLAITNADNWCYYFTSYHDWIVEYDLDWRGLTPEEVARRR